MAGVNRAGLPSVFSRRFVEMLVLVMLYVFCYSISDAQTWDTHYRRGVKAVEKQDWDKAAEHFSAALAEAERIGPARVGYGWTTGRTRNREDPEGERWIGNIKYSLGAAYTKKAAVCLGKGCVVESDSLCQLAIPLFESSSGVASVATGAALSNLGLANLKLGRTKEAEPVLRRALSTYEAAVPMDSNAYVPRASIDLADAYIANRKYWEAEPLLLSVSDNVVRVMPNLPQVAQPYLHTVLAESQYKLAGLYSSYLEHLRESDSLYESALIVYESDTLVAFPPEADSCFLDYESKLRSAGRIEIAESISLRLQSLRSRRVKTDESEKAE